MNRVTTPKLPPPPRNAQNSSAFSYAVGGADLAVGGDDLDLLEVVDGPAEAAHQVAEAAAQGQAGDADLGDEPEHGREPVLLGRLVDVGEQAPGSDVREPGVGVDGDLAHAGHVEGQAALGDGGAGDVVAAALDAEQQAVVAGEPDGRGDVVGRDAAARPAPGCVAAMAFQTSTASSQPSSSGRSTRPWIRACRSSSRSWFRLTPSALASGDVDGGHDAATSTDRGAERSAQRASRNAWGCSRGGSSPASSITCSGQP